MEIEEEVAEIVSEVSSSKGGIIATAVLGLVVLGAGVGIGYVIGRRKSTEVIKLGDRPITRPPKVVIDETLTEQPVVEVVATEVRVTVNDRPVEESNIFGNQGVTDDWDYEEEMKKRDPLMPFVIHRDEFFEDDPETEDFVQAQYTYYAGDGVLVDDQNQIVYSPEMVVGPYRWGHGSDDPNCFYIRNMARNLEAEVIRDPGRYDEEVMGLDASKSDELSDRRDARQRTRFPRD